MKKKIFILIILFNTIFSISYSQNVDDVGINSNFKDFPQEKIFVHFNTSFLVSGENLFYKIYCLNTNSNTLSNLSKIAYVELINSDRNKIIKQKIVLKLGIGIGDFFVKASIPSGNYKLIAYTQWMRNNGENTFFQNDITIINPFRANKRLTVKTEKLQDTIKRENILVNNSIKPLNIPVKNEFVEANTNKKIFNKREKVLLTLKALKDEFSYGNYSVSIKKIDNVNAAARQSSILFTKKNNINAKSQISEFYLPELRGELISGTVYSKETNTTMPNVKVFLSIPDQHAIFKIATTNKSGVFYFNIDKPYQNQNAIIQVIDSKKNEFNIEINNYKSPNYNNLVFNDFILSSELNDLILKKSTFNQIENAYHSIKKDSILPAIYKTLSYKAKAKKYDLNDYTKFKNLKETITEVVDAAYILQKNGEHTFHVKFYNSINQNHLLPLVLIDGVLIQNHNSIINHNSKNIKSIEVVRDKYIYGGQLFNGLIAIKTLKGDYKPEIKNNYTKSIELDKPQITKSYFKQEYSDTKFDRIPDFRNQLLWHPNLTFKSNEKQISFYTSDYIGDFEISIEGFTKTGKPVSIKEFITVKN